MALLNPFYSLILPFLFIVTIPLAIFATITTIIAFSILLFRVVLVYIELALAVTPYYLLGAKTTPRPPTKPSPAAIPTRRRKRRSSSSSALSAGSITPIANDSNLGISQTIGPARDYEGVGGWRLGDPSDEDTLWTKFNSRLELPADHVRRHHRSLTSGSISPEARLNRSYSPEAVMNTSRARTPSTSGFVGDGYFVHGSASPRVSNKTASTLMGNSGASGSSKGSSGSNIKQR